VIPGERYSVGQDEPKLTRHRRSRSRRTPREDARAPAHPDLRIMALAYAFIMPAAAKTGSSTFGVGATVVAACAILPQLSSHLAATGATGGRTCAPVPALSTIAAPQPVVTVIRDGTGRAILKIEF
jgi:hypothetical protein